MVIKPKRFAYHRGRNNIKIYFSQREYNGGVYLNIWGLKTLTKFIINGLLGIFIKKELYIIGEGYSHRDLNNKLEINMKNELKS